MLYQLSAQKFERPIDEVGVLARFREGPAWLAFRTAEVVGTVDTGLSKIDSCHELRPYYQSIGRIS